MRTWLLSCSFLVFSVACAQATEPCKPDGTTCPATGCSAAAPCCDPACTTSEPCKSEGKVKTAAPCCSASTPSCCVVVTPVCSASHRTGSAHAELIHIITDTESPDTFMVAVVALIRLEDNHPRALPLIVRKAEQLGILKGIAKAEKLTPAQCAVMDYLTGGPAPEQNAPAPYPVSMACPAVPPPPAPPAPSTTSSAVIRTWFDWVAHAPSCDESTEDK